MSAVHAARAGRALEVPPLTTETMNLRSRGRAIFFSATPD